MTYRISGILNNCGLNTALPIMLSDIKVLAKLEKHNRLPIGPDVNDFEGAIEEKRDINSEENFYDNYYQIKEIFCITYGLNNESFTWQDFHSFLKSQSFLENQIVFLSVFRDFLKLDRNVPYNLTVIHDNQDSDCGKYAKLGPDQLAVFFHHKFGIQIKSSTTKKTSTTKEISIPISPDTIPKPEWASQKKQSRVINLYLENEHYEITKDFNNKENDRDTLKTENPELSEIIDDLTASYTPHETNKQLARIRLYYHNTFKSEKYCLTKDDYIKSYHSLLLNENRRIKNQFKVIHQKFAIYILTLAPKKYKAMAQNILNSSQVPAKLAAFIWQEVINFKKKRDKSFLENIFKKIDESTTALIDSIKHDDFNQFEKLLESGACDVNCLVDLANEENRLNVESSNTTRILKALTTIESSAEKKAKNYDFFISELEKAGAEEEPCLNSKDLSLLEGNTSNHNSRRYKETILTEPQSNTNISSKHQNNKHKNRKKKRPYKQTAPIETKSNHNLCFQMLTSFYFKAFMLILLTLAALTLIALFLSPQLPDTLAFINNLSASVYSAILGSSIAGTSTASIGLGSSIFAHHNSSLFEEKDTNSSVRNRAK